MNSASIDTTKKREGVSMKCTQKVGLKTKSIVYPYSRTICTFSSEIVRAFDKPILSYFVSGPKIGGQYIILRTLLADIE